VLLVAGLGCSSNPDAISDQIDLGTAPKWTSDVSFRR